jgi:hypothetical protein
MPTLRTCATSRLRKQSPRSPFSLYFVAGAMDEAAAVAALFLSYHP